MKIGIIGGGLSAYLLAYRLKGRGYELHVFEDGSNLGGNCHTCDVTIGGAPRWADLAVNDFNAPMYREVVDIMDLLGVKYAPLEDTASFYTTDGSVKYTLDGGWGTAAPQAFEHLYQVFAARAWDVMNSPQYETTTVADFLATEPPFKDYPDFGRLCILPRVNAMYFCPEAGPENMLIRSAYHYYLFQEGFGTDNYASPNAPAPMVDRQYFTKGARSFVQALRNDALSLNVRVHTGGPATVIPSSGKASITQDGVRQEGFDRVVFTTHANQAAAALPQGYDAETLAMLKSVNYAGSTAYVHQDESLLPPSPYRRTYNVLIRSGGERKDYSMTYVINMHQADRENTIQDYFGCGSYFVSVNPVRVPQNILVDQSTGKPAQWDFPHNIGDLDLLRAQQALWGSNGAPPIQSRYGIFFCGGWTVGAGLMIECWESVKSLVALFDRLNVNAAPDPAREHFAPDYIRRLRPPREALRRA